MLSKRRNPITDFHPFVGPVFYTVVSGWRSQWCARGSERVLLSNWIQHVFRITSVDCSSTPRQTGQAKHRVQLSRNWSSVAGLDSSSTLFLDHEITHRLTWVTAQEISTILILWRFDGARYDHSGTVVPRNLLYVVVLSSKTVKQKFTVLLPGRIYHFSRCHHRNFARLYPFSASWSNNVARNRALLVGIRYVMQRPKHRLRHTLRSS